MVELEEYDIKRNSTPVSDTSVFEKWGDAYK